MFSPDDLNSLFKEVIAHYGGNTCNKSGKNNRSDQGGPNNQSNKGNQSSKDKNAVTPSQALVIAGILGGVLEVDSVLVDKEQRVEILLVGSLRQKTQLEKTFDQIGQIPFDEVLRALLGRFG